MNGRIIAVAVALVVTGGTVTHAEAPKMSITATDAKGKDRTGSVTIPADTATTIKWNATGVVPGSCSVLKDHPPGPPWEGISEIGEKSTGRFTDEFNGRTYTLQCTNPATKAAVKSEPVAVNVAQ